MTEFFESLASLVRKPTGYADEKPFQAEFFSVERLEQFAQTLAAKHKTVTRKGRAQLLPRLEDNARKLEAAYQALVEALREGRAISPAAEWLVDNYHIVEEQLREIRQDLPKELLSRTPKTRRRRTRRLSTNLLRRTSRSSLTLTRVSTQTRCKDS